jgi:hypothetical protein
MKFLALIVAALGLAPTLAAAQDDNMGTFQGSTSSSGSSHTESSSSSSSSSVTFGVSPAPAPQLGSSGPPPGWPGHHDADPVKALAGTWTLSAAGTTASCRVELYYDKPSDGLQRAWLTTGCPEGFFTVTRWRSDGRTLELSDMFSKSYGVFHRAGRNRFEGQRASDNGAVTLSR